MIQLGEFRLHLIVDAYTKVDAGGPFGLVPMTLYRSYFEPDAQHLIPMVMTCLLIQRGDQVIVVDTGLGDKLTDKQQAIWHLERPAGGLVEGLARAGVRPEEVTLVINTHLHADHCAGNTRFLPDFSGVVPVFPNAEYVVQRREYEDAMRPNERTASTYFSINWESLVASGQMRLLEGDAELAPGVFGVVTPGHTPGHMSVRLESGDEAGLFTCDLASYAVHFERLSWMTAYDVEPLVTLETKRRWQQWALETGALLMFPHDVRRPAGRLAHDERGRLVLHPLGEVFT